MHVQGKKTFFVCVFSVLAHSELVAYTLQRPGRIRPHFAFRAASDLGSMPGTDVRTFLKTESLQGVKRSADCEDHQPSDYGIIMREQFQLDLYCRTAAPDGILSLVLSQSEENTTHANSLYGLALYWKGSVPTLKVKLATASLQPAAI